MVAGLCAGCASAQNANVDARPDQPVDPLVDASPAIDAPVQIGLQLEPEVTWQGPSPLSLGDVGNRMCFLTGAGGAFNANAEVKVYASGTTWYVAGSGSVRAAARCITWMNGGVAVSNVYDWAQGQPPVVMGAEANRLCGLTRMAGQFRGGGEVIRASVDAATWKLGGNSQQTGVAASAQCLTWPVSAGISSLGELAWEQGQGPQSLGSGNRACVLTMIAGSYRGAAEVVEIKAQGVDWLLTGSSQQSGVAARSRCLAY